MLEFKNHIASLFGLKIFIIWRCFGGFQDLEEKRVEIAEHEGMQNILNSNFLSGCEKTGA